ncbi:2-isopropylmalate synthase [Deinobacterium chartae]|uniref:Citramalate synthase n=1 Tax=Deinobacterium chartae TaxID=521158 RepID=A0A841I3N2_9DEIO|nr:citramalate synthase [Deinobacterium chartae]MBB6099646.1 2-isopropylmalate synthase [Deinobacterium chartae]
MNITLLDTTLRDGALTEDINLSIPDKLRLASLIDSLGVTYLEGGWPQVFESDLEFFEQAAELDLKAKLTVFGATRRPETRVDRDANLRLMLAASTPVVHLYGKVWTLHVEKVLRTTRKENLAMLRDSVEFMKSHGKEVIFTAEHFFDGLRTDPGYALENIQVALEAGADVLSLGDSNGGALPWEIEAGVKQVLQMAGGRPVGLHLHDDLGMALGNALAGVHAGATHVQGTVNGYGARTGITDLTTLLPILKLKMGQEVVSDEQLARLTRVAHQVAEIVGLGGEMAYKPVVGDKVFAHKTQTHVSAVLSDPEAYETIDPERVGNRRKLLIPGLTRPTYLQEIARRYGVDLSGDSVANARILEVLRKLEEQGYTFEDAEASLELRLGYLSGRFQPILEVERLRLFQVIRGRTQSVVEAALRARVDGRAEYVAAEGEGPIDTLYRVILEALSVVENLDYRSYMQNVLVSAFRVRTLSSGGEDLRVRVSISMHDGQREWTTVGIDSDLIRAAWLALVDGVEYGLLTRRRPDPDAGAAISSPS